MERFQLLDKLIFGGRDVGCLLGNKLADISRDMSEVQE